MTHLPSSKSCTEREIPSSFLKIGAEVTGRSAGLENGIVVCGVADEGDAVDLVEDALGWILAVGRDLGVSSDIELLANEMTSGCVIFGTPVAESAVLTILFLVSSGLLISVLEFAIGKTLFTTVDSFSAVLSIPEVTSAHTNKWNTTKC